MGARNWTRLPTMLAALFLCARAFPVGADPGLEVYGRLPSLENVAISPDGTKIAFVRTQGNLRALAIVRLVDDKLIAGFRLGETKLRSIGWADDSHLLITTSTTTLPWGLIGRNGEYFQLLVFDLDSRQMTSLPKLEGSVRVMNIIAGRPMVRKVAGHTVLYLQGEWVSDVTLPALFKYDLTTRTQRLVRQGDLATRDWLVDDAGELAAEVDYYEHDQKWQLKVRNQGQLRVVASEHSAISYPEILGFAPGGDAVLIATMDNGRPRWQFVSLQDGKFSDLTAEQQAPDEPLEDPVTRRMIGGVTLGDSPKYAFFDPDRQASWRSITNAFEADQIQLTSFSGDFKQVVVLVTGPDGYQYRLVDLNKHHALPVGDVYDGLDKPLETRRITYTAGDGFEVPAYLTLPPGRPPTRLPLIVMPHGGPEARDSARFDWWAQALASQGYAVLKPNYRGSSVSWETLSAGFGQWGRKMQTDLSDGVRHLAKEGIIDPARVCIVGASYGGYAALAGVTLEPGIYRCAVSVAGISDLKRFEEWINEGNYYSRHAERYLDRYLGVTGPKDPALEAISPIKHVSNVSVPVLLVHGRDDTVVPFEQSDLMLSALKHANKTVDLVVLKKEDHWLSRSETRLLMLQSSIGFLRANNPPD